MNLLKITVNQLEKAIGYMPAGPDSRENCPVELFKNMIQN